MFIDYLLDYVMNPVNLVLELMKINVVHVINLEEDHRILPLSLVTVLIVIIKMKISIVYLVIILV